MIDVSRPRFPLGRVVATPGALEALEANSTSPSDLLDRHIRADFGDVCEEDRSLNEEPIDDGTRILSIYTLPDQSKVWVITEADRSSTCLLLPSEY
jgi:hypothetical protein